MLDLRGNTAVYLLYAHARIASIVKKAETTKGLDVSSLKGKHSVKVSKQLLNKHSYLVNEMCS